jgi:hypothetical protein
MPRILTHLQRDVIAYILAANEDQEPPTNSATHFMRVFEGGFSPTIPFTLFMPSANRVILYVAEEGANDSADRRSEFSRRCEVLKKPLVQIARPKIEFYWGKQVSFREKRSEPNSDFIKKLEIL